MNEATIQDLAINKDALLTPMVKANLVKVVEAEFDRQSTIYDGVADEKREKILNEYKESVGFDKLQKEWLKAKDAHEKAKNTMDEVEKKMNYKGLGTDGEQHHPYFYSNQWTNLNQEQRKIKKSCEKIEHLLKTVEASGPQNIKNKITARLWLSDTAGEAYVILREVLGNGIIPTLSKNDFKAITIQ